MLPDAITVEVTQADIDAGVRHHALFCPVGHAAHRALPGHIVCAQRDRVDVLGGSVKATYRPIGEDRLAMLDWMSDFDGGASVHPATFALRKEGA